MFRTLLMIAGLAWLHPVGQTALPADEMPPVSCWLPEDTVAVLEIPEPRVLLDPALGPKVAAAVTSHRAYREQAAAPGFKQFLGFVGYVEAQLDTDWRTGLPRILGGGITFAAGRGGATLLAVDARDGQMLRQLNGLILDFARADAVGKGRKDPVSSREYRGVTGWTFGPKEAHAILENRLLVANRPEVLRAILDLRAEAGGKNLASLPAYRSAKQAAGPGEFATLFVNMKILKEHPPLRRALTQGRNPLASLLFAGAMEGLRGSNWLAAGLHVSDGAVSLRVTVDGKELDPSGLASFASPSGAGGGALPNLSVPRRIAGLSLYRDLHGFYAAKDDLFPERTSGLIFFENMMGIFFSGLDLTDEVLAETLPEIRLVAAEQDYDPSVGTPRVQFPAFAAILHLRHPREFGEIVEEAWQKAVGLINFTRGQQALPGLIIDRPSHGDTKFTVAYFRPPKTRTGTQLESRYNVRPALALLGDYLILSSTEGLARDLIDALKKEAACPGEPRAKTHSLLELDGNQLASILRANRDNLIRQNMIEEGNTREQAEMHTDLLLTVLGCVKHADLILGSRDGRPHASLKLKLTLPDGEHLEALRRGEGESASGTASVAGGGSARGR